MTAFTPPKVQAWSIRLLGAALMLSLSVAGACLAQEDPLAWIDAELVRAAYHYANPPADERTAHLKAAGINCMILKAPVDKAMPYLREAKTQGMHCFLALNFNVDAEKEGLRPAVLADGRVERYVCPLDERFWHDHLTPAVMERVALSADPELQADGLWIDFELYSTTTGQRYYTNACYCDYCFGQFCAHEGIETPKLEYPERKPWLDEHGYAEQYQPYLGTRMQELATELRERAHEQNPDFLLGFYPTPRDWSLLAVARAFSTERVPILLWATDTYGGGGPDRVPDDWRALYADQGINARYIAGMLLRCYSAKNLGANLYYTTAKCDGYWLFTTYTLENEEQKGDYYLAAGTPQEYWDAIRLGDEEISRRIEQGPGYQSSLVVGPEPIVYKPLTQPEFRERLALLIPPEAPDQRVEYPEVHLRGANVVVLAGRAGMPAEVTLAYHQVGPNPVAISWQLMDSDRNLLASGAGDKAQPVTITFTPEADGIYYVLASAESAAYSVASANVPVGLYAGAGLHTIGGANRLYFMVPAGLREFTISPAGSSGHETVRVDVYNPEGRLEATGQSTAEETDFQVKVDAGARAGDVWSLSLTKADVGILEDNNLTLDAPLPPVVSLVPEQAFGTRVE